MNGYNQAAKEIGFSYAALYRLRQDQRNPGPETVLQLATYFKVDPDWLFELVVDRKPSESEIEIEKEKEWATVNDPELRYWLNAENLNRLPASSRRAIVEIIKTGLEEKDF
ncbi:MAG: helix-turn-helix transcriptional regulator [Chloroflexota bacterium]|nr:helix-turn-helix transcriptional regulator [Chloroflexota bacterium]